MLQLTTTTANNVELTVQHGNISLDENFEVFRSLIVKRKYSDGFEATPKLLNDSTLGKFVHRATGKLVTLEEIQASIPHTEEEIAAAQPLTQDEIDNGSTREVIPLRTIIPIDIISEREFFASITLPIVFPELANVQEAKNLFLLDGIKRLTLAYIQTALNNEVIK